MFCKLVSNEQANVRHSRALTPLLLPGGPMCLPSPFLRPQVHRKEGLFGWGPHFWGVTLTALTSPPRPLLSSCSNHSQFSEFPVLFLSSEPQHPLFPLPGKSLPHSLPSENCLSSWPPPWPGHPLPLALHFPIQWPLAIQMYISINLNKFK